MHDPVRRRNDVLVLIRREVGYLCPHQPDGVADPVFDCGPCPRAAVSEVLYRWTRGRVQLACYEVSV